MRAVMPQLARTRSRTDENRTGDEPMTVATPRGCSLGPPVSDAVQRAGRRLGFECHRARPPSRIHAVRYGPPEVAPLAASPTPGACSG